MRPWGLTVSAVRVGGQGRPRDLAHRARLELKVCVGLRLRTAHSEHASPTQYAHCPRRMALASRLRASRCKFHDLLRAKGGRLIRMQARQ
jgi:hypothetical protein